MAVLNLEANWFFGENGSGKIYIATDYDGSVLLDWTGTNEKAQVTALEADFTFGDLGFFKDFAPVIKNWEWKTMKSDYCGMTEISRKGEEIAGFTFTMLEILEMPNLALMLGAELMTDTWVEYISRKRIMRDKPYQLFKFESCAKDWKKNVMYFVRAVRISDFALPAINLSANDIVGSTIEYEIAEGWNHLIAKWITA